MSTSISARQSAKIVDTLEEKGITGEIVQDELIGKGRLADLAEAVVRGTIPDREAFRKLLGLLPVIFHLIVNYTMSLADMIKVGGYDWVNENIIEVNFPRNENRGKFKVDAELIHFGRNISSDSAVAEMDKMGYRPATIEELLSFGVTNPEIQRQFPVVAPRFVLRGQRRTSCRLPLQVRFQAGPQPVLVEQ